MIEINEPFVNFNVEIMMRAPIKCPIDEWLRKVIDIIDLVEAIAEISELSGSLLKLKSFELNSILTINSSNIKIHNAIINFITKNHDVNYIPLKISDIDAYSIIQAPRALYIGVFSGKIESLKLFLKKVRILFIFYDVCQLEDWHII